MNSHHNLDANEHVVGLGAGSAAVCRDHLRASEDSIENNQHELEDAQEPGGLVQLLGAGPRVLLHLLLLGLGVGETGEDLHQLVGHCDAVAVAHGIRYHC